jgi:SAM-dependent methyltransferase
VKYYVDEQVNIYTGEEAEKHLAGNNDARFVEAGKGIVRVPVDRWRVAQTAESAHWMKLGIASDNDRNYEHRSNFDNYQALRGRHFDRAIELGCGPFTNLRLIAAEANLGRCSLLDPLIERYLEHPSRRYDRTKLRGERWILPRSARLILRKLRRMMSPDLLTKSVPVEQLIASPIETMPTDRTYDLAVMVNVIEHCYDVNSLFANLLAVTRPGTTLVFHDKYYDHGDVEKNAPRAYDAAHPLRVDKSVIEKFLHDSFIPVFEKITNHEQTFVGDRMKWQSVYFIGTRRR